MDSQLFLYVNIAFGIGLMLMFMSARRNRGSQPTRLNLKNPNTEPKSQAPPEAPIESKYSRLAREFDASSDDSAVRKAKELNVLFIYNGHDWDAHQVLGIPAGASLPLVTERYQQLVKDAKDGQLEFYEAAYKAILKKR